MVAKDKADLAEVVAITQEEMVVVLVVVTLAV